MRTLIDNDKRTERRTAVVAEELKRYNIALPPSLKLDSLEKISWKKLAQDIRFSGLESLMVRDVMLV